MQPPLGEIMVEGPARDLRDLLCCLLEYALSVGRNPIDLRVAIKGMSSAARKVCATELVVQSRDVPDFLRRKLWETIRARRGEVSVVIEPECCRLGFTLPIERRQVSA